ncbi:MAG TPA: Xaa-Pro peptidase family protein [Dongiaceae bacterium]|nr:Xaa-Pro peptidase family protein [Dongiaceae bacterium]
MPQPYLNRERASNLLQKAGLDALVIAEPEGFRYATGVNPGVPALFRRAGAGFAVVPADRQKPVGVVIGDLYESAFAEAGNAFLTRSHPLWIEIATVSTETDAEPIEQRLRTAWRTDGRPEGLQRPNPFDISLSLQALRGVLTDLALADAQLGLDLDFVSANDAVKIGRALPQAQITDGSLILDRLRAVKAPAEVDKLRLGLELSEAGLQELTAKAALGEDAEDLRRHFRAGVAAEAARRGIDHAIISWEYISIGTDPWKPGGRIAPGTIIKADVGCVIDGYSSDCSRNFVFGAASDEQRRLHRHIEAAFAAGLSQVKPGKRLSDAYNAAVGVLHQAGLAGYSRGHIGHGIGHAIFSEQWPFISADTDIPFEENMVLAYEIPLYVNGFGGFNLEDQIIVTADGFTSMNRLPHELVIIPAR